MTSNPISMMDSLIQHYDLGGFTKADQDRAQQLAKNLPWRWQDILVMYRHSYCNTWDDFEARLRDNLSR